MHKITLKKNDIIKVGNYKYVIYKFGKEEAELIPIDDMLEETNKKTIVPKIKINNKKLHNSQKLDRYELLWLINQPYPLIREIVESFLRQESRRR